MRHVNWRYSRSRQPRARTHRKPVGRAVTAPALIDADDYFFTCSRYIELNPVRAGLASPGAYRWSSCYKANAEARPDPLISPHALYTTLGDTTPAARAEAYRALFEGSAATKTRWVPSAATSTAAGLGADRFSRHRQPPRRPTHGPNADARNCR